jgi:hypothetical protein
MGVNVATMKRAATQCVVVFMAVLVMRASGSRRNRGTAAHHSHNYALSMPRYEARLSLDLDLSRRALESHKTRPSPSAMPDTVSAFALRPIQRLVRSRDQ